MLFDALVLEALEAGITSTSFEGYVLVDNHPMLELLRHIGAQVRHDDAGTTG